MPDAFLDSLSIAERAQRWERILSTNESVQWVASGRDETIVAFASSMPSRDADGAGALELAALYVSPTHLRCGLGKLLLGAIDVDEVAREARAQTLWVLEGNTAARRFYEAMGFAHDGAVKLDDRFGDFRLREVRYRRSHAT
jgi:GNAT superfamily N-acetyltransferase